MERIASQIPDIPFHAVIVAAGTGNRAAGTIPKQYQKIGQKTILRRSIEQFLKCPGLQNLRIIIHPDHHDLYKEAIEGLTLPPPIDGGKERKDSIFKGIQSLNNLKNEDIILFHDAARPFISIKHIKEVAYTAKEQKAATLALPVSETLKYENGSYADRNNLWALQTPQGFHYGLIKNAHEKADENTVYTDDTSLVEALGHKVSFVTGSRDNIKITWPEDLVWAENYMSQNKETRTGMGFDVHAFDKDSSGPIRLCGIDIDHHYKLKGHSDADVGLHALTDAILGTIGAGDIGQHFPPSDPQWKNQDSALFLQEAIKLLNDKGGRIINVDITLLCEAPKIGPHNVAIVSRIAKICNLEESRINVKATTTEKLGFTGREEGIAAQAIATIEIEKNND